MMQKPCFDNLLKVLAMKVLGRPTLFEFFLNEPLYRKLAGGQTSTVISCHWDYSCPLVINACNNASYDYAAVLGSWPELPKDEVALRTGNSNS